MGELADKRLGDLLPTIDAYRPVALTIAAILGIVALLPAIDTDGAGPPTFAAAPAANDTPAPTTPPTTASAAAQTPTPTTTTPRAIAVPTPSPTPAPSPAPAPAPTTPPTTAATTFSPPTTSPPPQPVRITDSGWASATGGSPLAVDDVPEGTLPVGTRVAQTDKIAFVRLSGTSGSLVLAEDAGGRRGNEFETSPVQACQITDAGWEGGEDQAMSEAPAYDPEACVVAQQQPDGTWSIPLFVFADPTDARGLALVPTPDAPIDFQVTFAAQAIS